MGVADKVPPNLKFAILALTIPIFTLYTLALVGCVSLSPGVPQIYLFLLRVNEIALRVGYFAVCAVDLAANGTNTSVLLTGPTNKTDGTICVPTLGLNATELSVELFGAEDDVMPVLELALTLQRRILVPIILVAAFLMLFGAIFFALAKVTQMKLKDANTYESAMKQIKIFKPATLGTLWMSVLFAFAAAVASTMAVGALNFIIPVLATNINVTGGRVLQAFQYLSFILGALFALGATLMLQDSPQQQAGVTGDQYPQVGDEYPQEGDEYPREGDEYPPEGEEYDQGGEKAEGGLEEDGQYPQEDYEGQEEGYEGEGDEYNPAAYDQQYQQQAQQPR